MSSCLRHFRMERKKGGPARFLTITRITAGAPCLPAGCMRGGDQVYVSGCPRLLLWGAVEEWVDVERRQRRSSARPQRLLYCVSTFPFGHCVRQFRSPTPWTGRSVRGEALPRGGWRREEGEDSPGGLRFWTRLIHFITPLLP